METLFLLAHPAGPVTPTRIAERLGITAGAVTQLVNGLKRENLVEIATDPRDRRSRVLQLTDAAAQEVARFEADILRQLQPRFDSLSDGELGELGRLLAEVAEEGEGGD